MQIACPQCHRKLPMLRRLLGKTYCSTEHETLDLSQQSILALARVMDPGASAAAPAKLVAKPIVVAAPVEEPGPPEAPLIRLPIPPRNSGRHLRIAEEAFDFVVQPVYASQSANPAIEPLEELPVAEGSRAKRHHHGR